MKTHRIRSNFNILSTYDGYAPNGKGVIILLLWILVGVILANIVEIIYTLALGKGDSIQYSMIIAYPLMFIPAMIWAAAKSRNNFTLEEETAIPPIDRADFGNIKPVFMVLMVMVATVACQILCDNFSLWMPEMPESLSNVMKSLTTGNIYVSLLLVSVFAPIFEEWLCRGMILRGLAQTKVGPMWAVVISAVIFGLIHGNPWQALPAIVLGILFGYVYIATGSLKLTMLMHCTNNTIAVLVSQFSPLAENDSLLEVMEPWQYITIVAASAVILTLFVRILSKKNA
ncbi:MAG: CPBP family intramembrane metalloprotease [Bacteroidales bacterium]|nr:CPBP family intramembrane metalloprotease [Bacteroidales bacterium]